MTTLTRRTNETRVRIRLDATPATTDTRAISTTDRFFDHMLVTFAKYAGFQLDVDASGDLRHHLIEDTAITLGAALKREVPDACVRYGAALVPMDDALVQVAIDVGGRAFYQGPVPSRLYEHFMRTLAGNAGMTLHVRVLRGTDRHHIVEAAFKALGFALRQAFVPEGVVFSTKGGVVWESERD